MRRLILILNIISGCAFATLFTYTYFAKTHVESLARDYVTERTVEHVEPIVDDVESLLDAPLLPKLMNAKQLQAARDEVRDFRNNPKAYVTALVRQRPPAPEKKGKIAKQVARIKDRIREFYEGSIQALLFDLRIFSGTNFVAVLVAILLLVKANQNMSVTLATFSLALFAAVLFCSWMYIDDLSFFRVIGRAHPGWWYPIVLTTATIYVIINGFELLGASIEINDSVASMIQDQTKQK